MTDYTVSIPIEDDAWTEEAPRPTPSFQEGEYIDDNRDTMTVYQTTNKEGWGPNMRLLAGHSEQSGLHEGQYLDGEGVVQGTPTYPVHADYDNYLLALGNDADTGEATNLIVGGIWQGHAEFRMAQDDKLYLPHNAPFSLEITRTYTDDDGWGHIPWGWRVDMISEDPQRDITARAIGVYSTPACQHPQDYLYTTGAFVDDGNGNYYTECPVGQRKANPEPVYFALLLGSIQEGIWRLEGLEKGSKEKRLFWKRNQDKDRIPVKGKGQGNGKKKKKKKVR